ncbi:hypothetical protein PCL_08676 [Purpureocillium lilacinum]|uniref:Uncharacterized protein n=1 Tax=Purpureocillium lilacinum TaxID=33203 RepID=A0A2U3DQY2_PURLI|nr:hypothetical protein PCL_08676 [Purpureocillium lilacinum]
MLWAGAYGQGISVTDVKYRKLTYDGRFTLLVGAWEPRFFWRRYLHTIDERGGGGWSVTIVRLAALVFPPDAPSFLSPPPPRRPAPVPFSSLSAWWEVDLYAVRSSQEVKLLRHGQHLLQLLIFDTGRRRFAMDSFVDPAILGWWIDSNVEDEDRRHAVVGHLDTTNRLFALIAEFIRVVKRTTADLEDNVKDVIMAGLRELPRIRREQNAAKYKRPVLLPTYLDAPAWRLPNTRRHSSTLTFGSCCSDGNAIGSFQEAGSALAINPSKQTAAKTNSKTDSWRYSQRLSNSPPSDDSAGHAARHPLDPSTNPPCKRFRRSGQEHKQSATSAQGETRQGRNQTTLPPFASFCESAGVDPSTW